MNNEHISFGSAIAFTFCMIAITYLWVGAGILRFFAWIFGMKSGLEDEKGGLI